CPFSVSFSLFVFFFFQAEDGIRDDLVTGVQTCALPIFGDSSPRRLATHIRIRVTPESERLVPGAYRLDWNAARGHAGDEAHHQRHRVNLWGVTTAHIPFSAARFVDCFCFPWQVWHDLLPLR